jgi:hypothetical protein
MSEGLMIIIAAYLGAFVHDRWGKSAIRNSLAVRFGMPVRPEAGEGPPPSRGLGPPDAEPQRHPGLGGPKRVEMIVIRRSNRMNQQCSVRDCKSLFA